MILAVEAIEEIHTEAIKAGLHDRRNIMMVGIPAAYVAGIRDAENPRDQLMLDLNAMNETLDPIADGVVPLARWLYTAAFTTKAYPNKADFFRRFADQVKLFNTIPRILSNALGIEPEKSDSPDRTALEISYSSTSTAKLDAAEILSNVSIQIRILKLYKDIHDNLQRFQIINYNEFKKLKEMAKKLPAELDSMQPLRRFLRDLSLLCKSIRPAVEALPEGVASRDPELRWLDRLDSAATLLKEAIDARTTASIFGALNDVRNVLRREPRNVESKIFLTAKGLRLDDLAAKFDAAIRLLQDNDQKRAELAKARDSLLALSPTLTGRVVEHSLWQRADMIIDDLSDLLETPGSGTVYEFAQLWPGLKSQMRQLIDLDPGGAWTSSIDKYTRPIDELLAREVVDDEFILGFEAYRDEAQQRFFDVDLLLKSQCEIVMTIGQPLERIIGELGNG